MREVWYPQHKKHHQQLNRASRRKRLDRVDTYKLSKGCADCGYAEEAIALDFDHLRDKTIGISVAAQNYKWERLIEEIEKCEVVCANCHRIRTRNRRNMLD